MFLLCLSIGCAFLGITLLYTNNDQTSDFASSLNLSLLTMGTGLYIYAAMRFFNRKLSQLFTNESIPQQHQVNLKWLRLFGIKNFPRT